MSDSAFDSVYKQIKSAVELSDTVPVKFKNEVFEMLMKAIQNDGLKRNYQLEITEKSKSFEPINVFIDKYKPSSNIERTLCFTKFCQLIGINSVTSEHLQACYELCNFMPPTNLQQNIRDACSKRYGYLYTSDTNSFKVDTRGELFIKNIEEEMQ